jgi:hypothetical protein
VVRGEWWVVLLAVVELAEMGDDELGSALVDRARCSRAAAPTPTERFLMRPFTL